ncbi:MAG: nitroreductase family protein [Pseudomonadota bacterium]
MGYKSGLSYHPLSLPDRMDFSDDQVSDGAHGFRTRMANRHTIRDFSDRPVPFEIVRHLIEAAGNAPSGANHQPWHFVAISDADMKAQIRAAAEEEEEKFYGGGAPDDWLAALEPIGTGVSKPHLTTAPWLVVVFAQRYGISDKGERYKNYYVPESVGIASGFFIAAAHHAGLYCLTHTPSPMGFLTKICERPDHEKPLMVIALGHAAEDCTVPKAAKIKKPFEEICTRFSK